MSTINNPASIAVPSDKNYAMVFCTGQAGNTQSIQLDFMKSGSTSKTYTFSGTTGLLTDGDGNEFAYISSMSAYDSIQVTIDNTPSNGGSSTANYQIVSLPTTYLGMTDAIQVATLSSEDLEASSDYDYNDSQVFVMFYNS